MATLNNSASVRERKCEHTIYFEKFRYDHRTSAYKVDAAAAGDVRVVDSLIE